MLRFMCSARCLIVLYIYIKFRENLTNCMRVMEWTRDGGNNMFTIQIGITPKIGKPELRIICFAHWLMVFYTGLKFCETISNNISYEAETKSRSADGRTDVLTYGHLLGTSVNCSPQNTQQDA